MKIWLYISARVSEHDFSFLAILMLALFMMSCSSTNWVVVTQEATDENEFEVIETKYYLEADTSLSPNDPILYFNVKSINTLEYPQRVRVDRYVQRYKPRLGYVLLGMAGAGLSTYAAFSEQLITEPTKKQQYALLGAGGVLTSLSFINMRSVGEPTQTGESRLLRKTGTTTRIDTSMSGVYEAQNSILKMYHNGSLIAEREGLAINDGRVALNLSEEIDPILFEEKEEGEIRVEITVDSLRNSVNVPVSAFFEQFIIVDSQISPLRNSPNNNPNNILIDLAEGSQLRLVSRKGGWFKVMYGLSETWLESNDARVVWRPSEFASDLSVITVPDVPFGSIDVERNIPVLSTGSRSNSAFILSNHDYQGDLPEKVYGARDTQLMEEYFKRAFSIRENNIVKAENVNSNRLIRERFARLSLLPADSSSTLLVYLNGYAEVRDSTVYLSNTSGNDQSEDIDLNALFNQINNHSAGSIVVLADLDFIADADQPEQLIQLASIVTEKDNRAVLFAARPDQRSGLFTSNDGPQNRHSLFTYFLAEAFQQRKTRMNDIFNHLGRNVTFTSRSIYDRPQNPLLFGNGDLQIMN